MNWFRNGTAAIATMLMGVLAPMSGWQNRGPSDFQLSLIREYGRALFSQCRLEVVAYSGEGTASLTCSYAGSMVRVGQSLR